jgi:hypothetical protein
MEKERGYRASSTKTEQSGLPFVVATGLDKYLNVFPLLYSCLLVSMGDGFQNLLQTAKFTVAQISDITWHICI